MGHLLDVFLHPRGRFGPTGAAQSIKPRHMAFGAAVSLNLVEPVERDVQFVAAGKFQDQIIAVEVLHREAFEALILGDAMLDVDDIVAHVEILQRGEERRGLTLRLRLMARCPWQRVLLPSARARRKFRRQESGGQIAVQDVKRRVVSLSTSAQRRRPFRGRHVVFA